MAYEIKEKSKWLLYGIFSEVGGRTVCRLLVRDAAGENESSLLHETVPSWVTDIVVEKTIPKFVKIPFYLLPHPQMVKQDRMKKVIYRVFVSVDSKIFLKLKQ